MAAQRVRTVSTPLLSHHHHIFCSRITTLPARLNELTHVLPLTKDTQMQGSSVAPFQPVYTLTSSPPSWSISEGLHFGNGSNRTMRPVQPNNFGGGRLFRSGLLVVAAQLRYDEQFL